MRTAQKHPNARRTSLGLASFKISRSRGFPTKSLGVGPPESAVCVASEQSPAAWSLLNHLSVVFGVLACSHHITNEEYGARHRCMR